MLLAIPHGAKLRRREAALAQTFVKSVQPMSRKSVARLGHPLQSPGMHVARINGPGGCGRKALVKVGNRRIRRRNGDSLANDVA
jgi:hypothetical protein